MKKSDALALWGGDRAAIATAVGVTVQAISAWPEELPPRIRDRVQAALWRLVYPDDLQASQPESLVAPAGTVINPGRRVLDRALAAGIPADVAVRLADRRGEARVGGAEGEGE